MHGDSSRAGTRFSAALDTLRRHDADRDLAARRWHAQGGGVVGYFCDSVPVELIGAAGFLPYRLSGRPGRGRALVAEHLDVVRTPFTRRTATIGFVETAVDALLAGDLDFVDHLVVPHTRKVVAAVHRQLLLAGTSAPELRLPNLHFLDRAMVGSASASDFHRAELAALVTALETWSGTRLSAEAVADAVTDAERGRELLRRVDELRRADPPRLSGVDALAITGSAQVMPRRRHNALLAELLDTVPPTGPSAGPRPVRIHMAGSPQDHPAVYRTIEALGAVVVGEDHCWGSRLADAALRDASLGSFTDRYDRMPACSVSFPLERTVARCLAAVSRSRPDGVVVLDLVGDEAQLWESPDEIEAIEASGVPTLHLSQQPYARTTPPDVAARLARFVEGLTR